MPLDKTPLRMLFVRRNFFTRSPSTLTGWTCSASRGERIVEPEGALNELTDPVVEDSLEIEGKVMWHFRNMKKKINCGKKS